MPMEMKVKFDCEELLKQFDFLGQDRGKLRQKITRAILKPLRTKTRRNVRKVLKYKTGRTARYTDTWAFKDGTGKLVLGTFYGRILTEDHYITPKVKTFLTFKIGKKWIKTKKSIFIPKKDLVETIWKEGTADSVMIKIADEVLQKEFDKWRAKK